MGGARSAQKRQPGSLRRDLGRKVWKRLSAPERQTAEKTRLRLVAGGLRENAATGDALQEACPQRRGNPEDGRAQGMPLPFQNRLVAAIAGRTLLHVTAHPPCLQTPHFAVRQSPHPLPRLITVDVQHL